jgi:cytochrome b561
MMQETATPAYTALARALHWFTAALIMIIIPLGLVIYFDLGGRLGDQIYDLHRSIGALLIPIVLLRVAYRLFHKPARLPDDISYLQRFMAHATHWTLYALIIVQPFIGWIATSAFRAPVPVFALFELPPIWPEQREFSERMFVVHALIGFTIGVLVAMHITAALHHHFVRKDRILARMIKG